MLLEHVDFMYSYRLGITDTVIVDTLSRIRRERKWGTVHPKFMDSLYGISTKSKQSLKENTDVTSDTDSVHTISDNTTRY